VLKFLRELRVHECISILSDQHYQVKRHWQAEMAKPFPNKTFNPVTLHRAGNVFLGDDNTKPGTRFFAGNRKNQDIAARNLESGVIENALVIGGI